MFRRIALAGVVSAGLAALLAANDPTSPSRDLQAPSKPDRSYGTAVQWESKLEVASKKAEREHKLLMVLAVAGHFEDPFFT